MARFYADIPKFKRVHHAMVETVRQTDEVLREINKALAGRRTEDEVALLNDLKSACTSHRRDYLDTIEAFVAKISA